MTTVPPSSTSRFQGTLTAGIAALGSLVATIIYFVIAFQTPTVMQPFIHAGATALIFVCALVSMLLVQFGWLRASTWVLIWGAQIGFLVSGLALSGLGIPLGFGVVILTVMVGAPLLGAGWGRTMAVMVSLLVGAALLIAEFPEFFFLKWGFSRPAPGITVVVAWSSLGAVTLAYLFLLVINFNAYSLRAKFIFGLLVTALLPIVVLALLSAWITQTNQTTAARKDLTSSAAQTASLMDTFFDDTLKSMYAEALLPAWKSYLTLSPPDRPGSEAQGDAIDHLTILRNKDSRILTYLLLDAEGTTVLSTNTLDVGQNRAHKDYFQQALLRGQPYVSSIEFEGQSLTGSIYFSSLIRDNHSEIVGVLVARYNGADVIESLLRPVKATGLGGEQAYATVFDEHLVRLGHSEQITTTMFRLVIPEQLSPEANELFRNQALTLQDQEILPKGDMERVVLSNSSLYQGLSGSSNTFTSLENERNMQAASAQLKTQPWRVVFFQPEEAFLKPLRAQTLLTVGVVVGMSLVVAILGLILAQLLTRPLVQLTSIASQVAKGDFAVRAPVSTQDEIGALATTFNGMTSRLDELVKTLEERVASRTAQLQAATEIGRVVASQRDLDNLLSLALELIRQRFGYYHASIFLVDESGRTAWLRESTGEVGTLLKGRGHKLLVGSNSLIGWVTQHRQHRIAREVAEDPFHFKNPLLPNTRSELAIPLIFSDRLLGALDVQSTSADAFDEGSVQVLQTLADLLSVAIENAALFQRTEKALAEMRAAYHTTTRTSWRAMLNNQDRELAFDLPGTAEASAAPETLSLPVRLRDQTMGTIELEDPQIHLWGGEEKNVLLNVAGQLATALEGAVLLEESQRRRAREQLVNDVTSQMRSTLNPVAVLEQGIRGLGKALGATEITVRLTPPTAPTETNTPPAASANPAPTALTAPGQEG